MRLRSALRSVLIAGFFAVLTVAVLPASVARADVDDFSYSTWDSQYQIGLDDEGRALMHVTETVVAEFPQTDQNRGIVRGLAEVYGSAPLYPRVISVTDGEGHDVPYETESDDDVLFVSIDDDTYKHGSTTYVIEYTMRDVFHTPDDAEIDEFYWDLLPLDSTQDIARFTGSIRFDDALTGATAGLPSCYQGGYGAKATCDLVEQAGVYTVTATDLGAGEGVTVAFPFEPGTVTPSPALQPDPLTDVIPYGLAGGGLLLGGAGLLSVGLMKRRHRGQGDGIVVAQYEVPADLPPLLAALLEGSKAKAIPAEIVHLGVHGALRIEDGKKKPRLTFLAGENVGDPLDSATLRGLFPDREPGDQVDLGTPDTDLARRLSNLPKTAATAASDRGLTESRRSAGGLVLGILGVVAGLIAVGLAIPGLAVQRPAAIVAFVISVLLLAATIVLAVLLMLKKTVLTPKGAETRELLLGAREYIRLAEADRIRMLQSYTGAERRSDGEVDIIVLYERLLPYAMLFGLEKEWAEVLEVQYERAGSAPGWYAGYTMGSFGSSLSTMGATLHATPVATSSSSSSGSFGGGFSGGGGGGGFSGGR
ncbi:DUF2207 domain-containing protein [Microbacterium bovistercoris]|uniref:DUF2207 domain-containing protein n=1 Tax=Microbacterium bovistercoris TaxID=2293570 RepID=A0A371NQL6_9MICO|nr:DUF2207 domain-containing protein [Microbacterium bovistercoris]REJ04473.1 DUF2207 domain-containing protein [Microbacterium bovistercoris]